MPQLHAHVGTVYVCTGYEPVVNLNPQPGYVVTICPDEYIGDPECEGGHEIKVPKGFDPKVNPDGLCVKVGGAC